MALNAILPSPETKLIFLDNTTVNKYYFTYDCVIFQYYEVSIFRNAWYFSRRHCLISTVVSRYYDTAGIRKKYHYIQNIEISSINFYCFVLVGILI